VGSAEVKSCIQEQWERAKECCDICRNSDAIMEEAEALRQAYQAEEDEQENGGCRPGLTLDSRINIPSSRSVV
jgi:hypothetical protein